MNEEYEITDVGEMRPSPGHACWYVTMLKPDGTFHQTLFHKSTIEWRAAEYGLTDLDEILDAILHAPFRPRQSLEAKSASLLNPEARSANAAAPDPVSFWDARSTSEAREYYLERIAAAKTRVRVVPPKSGRNPLDVLKEHLDMTPEGIREKAEVVDTRRWVKHYGGLPVEPEPTMKEAPRAR